MLNNFEIVNYNIHGHQARLHCIAEIPCGYIGLDSYTGANVLDLEVTVDMQLLKSLILEAVNYQSYDMSKVKENK
jgi:hypothetical protein